MSGGIISGDRVTFVPRGGTPVTLVRSGGIFVRITQQGGKPVTYVKYGGKLVSVDREVDLPEEVKEQIDY